MSKNEITDNEILSCNVSVTEDLVWVEELRALHGCHATCSSETRACLVESKKLDSSMKKNTAAIRKLKTLQGSNADQIRADLERVNQSKYVSEAVTAILEAPIKLKDVKSVVRICSLLYQRYDDFGGIMHQQLVDLLVSPVTLARTKRIYIRLLFALIQSGMVPKASSSVFLVMRSLLEKKVTMKDEGLNDVLLLVNTFLKSGRQGLFQPIYVYPHESIVIQMAKEGRSEAAACRDKIEACNTAYLDLWAASETEQGKLKERMYTYFDDLLESLNKSWKLILRTKKHNESIMNTRGDVSEKKLEEYKTLCEQVEVFDKAVRSLAVTLGKSVPDFHIAIEGSEEQSFARVVETMEVADVVFDDPDDKAMYTDLPHISELVPSVLLGKQHVEDTIEHSTSSDILEDDSVNIDEVDAEDENPDETVVNKLGGDSNMSLRELISKLPECVSIELCDSFVIEFIYANGSKSSSQKLLAAALSRPPFGAMQLLPFYARIIASLSPWFPIIKEQTLQHLQKEFFGLKKKLDISTSTVEPRLRNATFIAELVKFGVYPPGKVFVQMRSLFDDFSRHNIDTACCIVQNCGRYLFKRPDTSERMVNMMNIMIKLKNARNLDNRQSELILACQASMYATDVVIKKKSRRPVEEYIRTLIYKELNRKNVASVCTRLRRIDWAIESAYVQKKIMAAVRKGKYDQLLDLAMVIENLGKYYPSFPVDIIDEVMEEVICGLEQPLTKYNQRRSSMVSFLAILCNHRIAPNTLLEETLNCLLLYPFQHQIQDVFFRMKLITTLAIAAKESIMRSRAVKNSVIRFMPYFEEFVLLQQPIPIDLQIDIEEMYSVLRIKRNQFKTHEEALQAIRKSASSHASRKPKQSLQSIAESGSEEDESDVDMQINDTIKPEASDISSESGSISDEIFSSDDELEARSVERSAEEESFERELALAMGTINQAEASRNHVHKHAGDKDASSQQDSQKMSFKIMMKKGGRDDKSKSVHIPVSSGVAHRLEQNKEAAAAEKAALKRMVLASDF